MVNQLSKFVVVNASSNNRYIVYQDGKHCSEYRFKGWDVDSFNTKREAEIFAYHWAYPGDYANKVFEAPEMVIGKEYDYSMGNCPVMMMIEIEYDDEYLYDF